MALSERGMAGRSPPLLLWAPSRLVRELRACCIPELAHQWVAQLNASAQATSPTPLPALAAEPLDGGAGLVARLACASAELQLRALPQLLAAARQCTLLTVILQPLAAAPTPEAAAAAAVELLPAGTAADHPLRTLVVGSGAARAPAERFLRHRLQQLGLGTRPTVGQPPLWCIHLQGEEQPLAGLQGQPGPHSQLQQHAPPAAAQQHQQMQAAGQVIIALELATGAPPSAAAAAAIRWLGPTAMQPELAALSASLAAVQPGSIVLDPFCGSGSLLAAALQRGAALAVGCDIDDTHFQPAINRSGNVGSNGGGSSSGISVAAATNGNSGSTAGASCMLMHADATLLQGLLPASSADAILTDLPYGYRTSVEGAAVGGSSSPGYHTAAPQADAAAEAEAGAWADDWQQLLGVLLRLAAHVLVPGGRLLAWLPCQVPQHASGQQHRQQQEQDKQQEQQLAEAGAAHRLCLLDFLPESRQGGYPRAVALFKLDMEADGKVADAGGRHTVSGSSTGRQEALLTALQTAAAGGIPVHRAAGLEAAAAGEQDMGQQAGQPGEASQADGADLAKPSAGCCSTAAAVQRRDVKYKQVRGVTSGSSIDVWRAAWLGDAAAVREYAAAGGDVNAQDRKKQTPLQFAAGYGRDNTVQLLLDLGAEPSAAADASGMAALHRAAARNHTAVLRLLLAGGADPWQQSAAGQTPLMYASQFGHEPAVAALLQHVAAAAAPWGAPAATVEGTADKAQQGQQQQQGKQSAGDPEQAALGAVSSSGAGNGFSSLLQYVALCDASGLSALHLAAQWGMAGATELLLGAGADPNQRSTCERQLSPAHLAARWGHPTLLRVLQRHGADLGAKCGTFGWTPLQEAEEWRRAGCAELLQLELGGGSKVEGSGPNGSTAP